MNYYYSDEDAQDCMKEKRQRRHFNVHCYVVEDILYNIEISKIEI